LPQSLSLAYDALERIEFDGMYYRRDIGHRWLNSGTKS